MRDCLAGTQGDHTSILAQLGVEEYQEDTFDF
jgi:hypothetical protein